MGRFQVCLQKSSLVHRSLDSARDYLKGSGISAPDVEQAITFVSMSLHTKINYRERGGEAGLLIDLFHRIGRMSQSTTRHLWSSRSEIMALDHRTFAETQGYSPVH